MQQLCTAGFKKLSIFNARGTNLLASAAAEAAINVFFERVGSVSESIFRDGSHQVESSPWSVILVAGDDIGWARFETEAAVYAGDELLFFSS